MKPDYKNWVPMGLIVGMAVAAAVSGILFLIFGVFGVVGGRTKIIFEVIFGILFFVFLVYMIYCIIWHNTFSYNGKRQMSRQIIEGIAGYVDLPANGTGLDIGCGSAALTIAVAKRNRQAKITGLDRWGKEYASFNRSLCESNARIEGVAENTAFVQGDACHLPFADETFDAVTSNYCYHNIPSRDRQVIILETLRVLKKGGTFAIHDIFSKMKYGDMQLLLKELEGQGYEKVELVDTTQGLFMTPKEAKFLALTGSALLVGKK